MDIRKIKKLIELLEESGVAEIEIREGEESVRIARHAAPGAHAHPAAATPVVTHSPPAAARASAAGSTRSAASPGAPAEEAPAGPVAGAGEHVVTAPMVGTYYNAPSPGAKPFVEIGEEIQAGQVLCVIEAMKMMNQIESEIAGRIRAVLLNNGEPVEFGQPLFIIE
ncbi:MAG TPA: acetyl-CoA carboxylase biotin carboxyl carrier protein [Steroidobacteraceae bacterium]|jgi:acetyl-CoA carboxylase biotin carboxyl carrier protein|nr:acetyl-CoA carboxylase biotin carboxyl carrier protein [Steroidobacteraceae bacterium]